MKNKKNNTNEAGSNQPSDWMQLVEFRRNNPWIEYSQEISKRIVALIQNNESLSQANLARMLQVTPQRISKILKGQENLTLETIYNLSKALNFELISFPEYQLSTPLWQSSPVQEECKVAQMQQYPDGFTRYETGNKSYSL